MKKQADTREGMERLLSALKEIDGTEGKSYLSKKNWDIPCLPGPDVVYNSFDIQEKASQKMSLPWRESAGYIAAEYAYLYPPGRPLIVPGERVSQEAANVLQWYHEMGFSVEGMKKEGYIEVLMHG